MGTPLLPKTSMPKIWMLNAMAKPISSQECLLKIIDLNIKCLTGTYPNFCSWFKNNKCLILLLLFWQRGIPIVFVITCIGTIVVYYLYPLLRGTKLISECNFKAINLHYHSVWGHLVQYYSHTYSFSYKENWHITGFLEEVIHII